MSITFEREKLYEEVWSEPPTKLAKKYGLSDNGLRGICKSSRRYLRFPRLGRPPDIFVARDEPPIRDGPCRALLRSFRKDPAR